MRGPQEERSNLSGMLHGRSSAWCQVRLSGVEACSCASSAGCPVLLTPLLLRWHFPLLQTGEKPQN